MDSVMTAPTHHAVRTGAVVLPADGLLGVQAPDGSLMLRDRLGLGIVEKVAATGKVRVRWLDAELDAWMDLADLHFAGEQTHVITVHQCDGHGSTTRLRHQIVETESLEYNWTVEFRPHHILRVIRADGPTWTFQVFPDIRSIHTSWAEPPEDADAEALTAAELALGWTWTEI